MNTDIKKYQKKNQNKLIKDADTNLTSGRRGGAGKQTANRRLLFRGVEPETFKSKLAHHRHHHNHHRHHHHHHFHNADNDDDEDDPTSHCCPVTLCLVVSKSPPGQCSARDNLRTQNMFIILFTVLLPQNIYRILFTVWLIW